MSDGDLPFARLRLAGTRFTGGRIPVDALEEIQRYQALVLAAARLEWQEAHPGQEIPEGFDSSLKLVIAEVQEGSAQVLLEREAPSVDPFADVFEDARDEVSRELSLLLDATVPVSEAPLFELKDFRALGSSLRQGDSLQVVSYSRNTATPADTVGVTAEQVQLTFADRTKELARFRKKKAKEALHRSSESIAGRLIAINAQKKSFTIRSLHFGEINGSYSDPDLTSDLKAVLNTSAKAPVVRLQADLQFRDGEAWRIKDVFGVELLEIDGQPWSRKLGELAALGPDWDGESPGAEMISFAALEAARDLVLGIVQRERPRPSIFPTEEGGVSLEWASALSVVSIEIAPDANLFELFNLPEGTTEGVHSEATSITDALAFAIEVTAK